MGVTIVPDFDTGGVYFDGGNDYATFGAATSALGVTNFTVDNKVYWLYSSSAGERIRDLDRDNDCIACERR